MRNKKSNQFIKQTKIIIRIEKKTRKIIEVNSDGI